MRPELAQFIQHCLEKEPGQRFQSARDLTFALKQLAGTANSGAVAASSFARTRRLPWIAASVILAAVALGAAYLANTRTTGAATAAPTHTAAITAPSFRQLTFRRGQILKARFAPDGQTVISSARWDGEPWVTQSTRLDTRATTPLEIGETFLASVSRSGELAVIDRSDTLGRVPLGERGVRAVLESVEYADWAPDGTMAAIRAEGRRQWLEYPLGRVIFEEPPPLSFYGMRVSPDGQHIALIQQPPGGPWEMLTIVDRDGRIRSRSQRRQAILRDGLAWTPDSREVWFGGAASDDPGEPPPSESAIRAMTLAGAERIVYRTAGSIRIEDIAPDGRALVARDINRRELRAVDVETKAERDLTWFGYSEPTGLSNDGRHVIFNDGSAFLRPIDGGPAIRLGDGTPIALSPDGKWVLVRTNSQFSLVPTGPGEARALDMGRLSRVNSQGNWTPDGKHLVLLGNVGDRPLRVFALPVAGGEPTAVTPEGAQNFKPIVSPDSTTVLSVDAKGTVWKYPLGGNVPPVALDGQLPDDRPLAWSSDNRSIWVLNRRRMPGQIFRIDLATGRRTLWYEIPLPDAASTPRSLLVHLSADGRTFVYFYDRHLAELYVAEGLK